MLNMPTKFVDSKCKEIKTNEKNESLILNWIVFPSLVMLAFERLSLAPT